jgi:hypothetical protein
MHENSVVKILSTFSRKEMTYFAEFAHSPYFNKHEGVKMLVKYLSEVFPKFGDTTCSRRILLDKFSDITGGDFTKLALLFTYIQRLLEKFLAQEIWEEQKDFAALLTARHLRKKKIFNAASKVLSAATPADPALEAKFFNELDRLAVETQSHQKSEFLWQKQPSLDAAFLAEKMRDACELLLRGRLLKMESANLEQHFAVREIRDHPEKYAPFSVIEIYRLVFEMVLADSPEYYQKVKLALTSGASHLPFEDLQNVSNYLQNFCVSRINQGSQDYHRELFDLYKVQLEKELIYENGFLNEWHYKNIAAVAIRLGEKGWVKNFLEAYRKKLRPEVAQDAFALSLASFFYSESKLAEVLDLLLKIETNDPNYTLESKVLLLRAYFDLEEFEALFSLCDSFSRFVQRNKLLSESRKEGYLNLLKFTKKIARLKAATGYSKKEEVQSAAAKIKLELRQSRTVFIGNWLQQKLGELEAAVGL